MNWSHLPLPGGLYDQHPKFVDHMTLLMDMDAEAEQKRQEKNKPQQKARPRKRR